MFCQLVEIDTGKYNRSTILVIYFTNQCQDEDTMIMGNNSSWLTSLRHGFSLPGSVVLYLVLNCRRCPSLQRAPSY